MLTTGDDTQPLDASADPEAVRQFLDSRHCNSWPVGHGRRIDALISRRDLDHAAAPVTTVRDAMHAGAGFPYVHADHPISLALERMRTNGVDVLPVVSRADIHELLGVVGLREILEAYGVPDSPFFSRSTPV